MSDVYNSYLKMRDQYFGSDGVATAEDMLNILVLVSMVAIYGMDRTSYDQLQKSNNVAGQAIKLDSATQILALIGATLAVLRIAVHRFMKDNPIVELLFSLIVWTIFLVVIIVSSQNNTSINNAINAISPNPTPAPSTNVVSQANLLNLALSNSTAELNWAIVGFVVTTIYTVSCVFRIVYAPSAAPPSE